MTRSAQALALALLAACATATSRRAERQQALPPALAARLAGIRCLLVAPLENVSDEPLVAEAATGTLASALDFERVRIFPVGELRALFEKTPLELPEGVSENIAVELGELLAADAVLYGSVSGGAHGASPEVTLTVRLAGTGAHETLFWRSVLVVPDAGEPFVEASRRAALEAAGPMLDALGSPGPRTCFDKARLDRVRQVARRAEWGPGRTGGASSSRSTSTSTTTATTTMTTATTTAAARRPSMSRRPETWAAKLATRERFVVEDVAFDGRSPRFERQAGLSDLALALAATPAVRIRLEGFVDAGASEKEDLHLSMEFARIVGRRLIELGVPRDRVTWAGRGREAPVSSGFSAKGRLANRRIEVVPLEGAR